jgi:eukaryotic-like serine/threonine-protein kinase
LDIPYFRVILIWVREKASATSRDLDRRTGHGMAEESSANSDRTLIGAEANHDFGERFKVIRWLGRGGMGDVYLAMDANLQRRVAIKVIRPDLSEDQEIRQRIERECLLHAKVGPHPHIVTLFDKLERGGELQLIMEYVEGQTLREYLDEHRDRGADPPRSEAFRITTQMLEALARIHAEGIVHRDIKPANVILTHDDDGELRAKLMDFGIARLESGGSQFSNMIRTAVHSSITSPGTPLYMAPEQFDSETFGPISARTDVYAMGVVFYELLASQPPFVGSLTEILRAHLNTPPPPLRAKSGSAIPEPLISVVYTALAKRPADRFASASSFRDTLMLLAEIESSSLSEMAQLPQMETDHAQKGKEDADEPLVPAQPAHSAAAGAAVSKPRRPAALARVSVAVAVTLVLLGLVGLWQVLSGADPVPDDDTLSDPVAQAALAVPPAPPATPAATPEPADPPEPAHFEAIPADDLLLQAPLTDERTPTVLEDVGPIALGPFDPVPEPAPLWPGTLTGSVPAAPTLPSERFSIDPQPGPDGVSEALTATAAPLDITPLPEETEARDLRLTHVVQRGDSLSKIAQRYNIDMYDLAIWNELERPNDLKVGQTIHLYRRDNLKPVTPNWAQPARTPIPVEPPEETPMVAQPAQTPLPPPVEFVEEERRGGFRQWFRNNFRDSGNRRPRDGR